MQVDERIVGSPGPGSEDDRAPSGWLAVRQPGLVGFLEERLGQGRRLDFIDLDALAVALDAAEHIVGLFERQNGVPPPRVPRSLLHRAEQAAAAEIAAQRPVADGCAARQPALVAWVIQLLAEPPVPLRADESRAVAMALVALIYALDELTAGRPVP